MLATGRVHCEQTQAGSLAIQGSARGGIKRSEDHVVLLVFVDDTNAWGFALSPAFLPRLDEQHKLNFIPSQIYGVIRVSLIPVQDIRTAMIRVLCDMIYVINKHQDSLSVFENEFVTVMDRFASEPLVDKTYKEYLINAYVSTPLCRSRSSMCVFCSIDDFCKAKKLARNGSKLVDMIDNLLSRIIELRAAVHDSETAALDVQMHCVRSLMVRIEREIEPFVTEATFD